MRKSANRTARFAVCLNSEGYEASLETGKLYRMIPDKEAEAHGYVRIVDESGEDYAFASDRFHPVRLPLAVKQALSAPSRS